MKRRPHLDNWSYDCNISVKVSKMKELIVDSRMMQEGNPLDDRALEEKMGSSRYLCEGTSDSLLRLKNLCVTPP